MRTSIDHYAIKSEFYRSLRVNKTEQAQQVISSCQNSLPRKLRNFMLAELRLKQRRYGDAFRVIEMLKDQPANQNRLSLLAAQAHLGLNRQREVLGSLAEIDRPFSRRVRVKDRVLILRLRALLQLGHYQRIVEIASRELAVNPNRPIVQKWYLSALVLAGDTKKAELVLEAALKYPAAGEVLRQFVSAALCGGHHDLIIKRNAQIFEHDISFSQCVSISLKHLDAVEAANKSIWKEMRASFLTAIVACSDVVENSVVAHEVAVQLAKIDAPKEAQHYKNLCKSMVERNYSWLETRASVLPSLVPVRSNVDESAVEEVAGWVGVPADQMTAWRKQVLTNERRHQELKVGLQISDQVRKDMYDAVELGDWREVAQRQKEGKTSILAASHMGLMAATITQFVKQGIPVNMVGGTPEMETHLPEGLTFLQVNKKNDENSETTRLACIMDVVRIMRSGGIVGIAGDAPFSSNLHSVAHRNFEFKLPDSIPRLAWKFNAPVFWISTHWHDDKLKCAVEKSPCTKSYQTYESYRDEWFSYYLTKMHEVASFDARNVRIEKLLGVMKSHA